MFIFTIVYLYIDIIGHLVPQVLGQAVASLVEPGAVDSQKDHMKGGFGRDCAGYGGYGVFRFLTGFPHREHTTEHIIV